MIKNNKIINLVIFTAVLLMPVFAVNAVDNNINTDDPEYQFTEANAGATIGGSAAGSQTNNQATIEDPLGLKKGNPIPELANRLITVALGISGVLALLAFVYGGILYMLAGVNAKNVEKGKEVMKYAVMGLFVIFSSYAIINFFLKTVLQVPGA